MTDIAAPLPTATTPPPKPGWKTTEFYFALAAKAVGALFALGIVADGTIWYRLAGLAAIVLSSLGYTVSRTLIKTAAVLVLFVFVLHASTACGGSRQKTTLHTIAITLHAIDAAEAGFIAFDGKHMLDLVKAETKPGALVEYRKTQAKIVELIRAAYKAVDVAATLDDDPSVNGMIQAAALVAQELAAIGVKP